MLKKTLKFLGCVILTFTLAITTSVSSFAAESLNLAFSLSDDSTVRFVVPINSPGENDYSIKAGDTLAAIAKKNNISTEALAAANGISNPNKIYANQKLALPGSATFTENAINLISGIELGSKLEDTGTLGTMKTDGDNAKLKLRNEKTLTISEKSEVTLELKRIATESTITLKGEENRVSLENKRSGKLTITDENGEKVAVKSGESTSVTGVSAEEKTKFDSEYYAEENPEVVEAVGTDPKALYEHFCYFGFWETRQPNEYFDVNVYYSAYPDLQDKFKELSPDARILALYNHYETFGSSPEENRYITNEEEAKKAGITIVSARDGEPVSQPPAAAPSVLYTMDRWWEEYFAFSKNLMYQFVEEKNLPIEAKNLVDSLEVGVEGDGIVNFKTYLRGISEDLAYDFQSYIEPSESLFTRIGDTIEGQKFLEYLISHPILSRDEYMLAYSLSDDSGYDVYRDSLIDDWGTYRNTLCENMVYPGSLAAFTRWVSIVTPHD